MSKFGIKQERFIGIDRDRITNTSKKKGGEPGGSVRSLAALKNDTNLIATPRTATHLEIHQECGGRRSIRDQARAVHAAVWGRRKRE